MKFTPEDDFCKLIGGDKAITIKTGWTNFVFLHENKVFRFPRTEFFANAILNEYINTKYIKKYLKVPATIQTLHFVNSRPYTSHEFIAGESLTDANLTADIAEDIKNYIKELQALAIPKLELLSSFLIRLAKATKNPDYDYKTFDELLRLEKSEKLVLVHGDFNNKNILVNDGRLTAVIDYAFMTKSCKEVDYARLCSQLPEIAQYLGEPNKKLVAMWNYIDNNYIKYMKIYHPEVVV
jgi:thiamine kinase-like enzyme